MKRGHFALSAMGSPHGRLGSGFLSRLRSSSPGGRNLGVSRPIAGTLELVDIREDHFVVSLKNPLGGYGELDWTVAGSRPDTTYRTLKFLGAVVGLIAGSLSIYAALVNFGLVPNWFER